MPAILLGRVVEAAALGLEEPQNQQQSQIIPPAPHQDGAKQGQRCSNSNQSMDDFWVSFLWM